MRLAAGWGLPALSIYHKVQASATTEQVKCPGPFLGFEALPQKVRGGWDLLSLFLEAAPQCHTTSNK